MNKIISLVFLIIPAAALGAADPQRSTNFIVIYGPPLKACVSSAAKKLALASQEPAETLANVAVNLCEQHFLTLERHCPISFDACKSLLQQIKASERQRALSIVVMERARPAVPPAEPAPPSARSL